MDDYDFHNPHRHQSHMDFLNSSSSSSSSSSTMAMMNTPPPPPPPPTMEHNSELPNTPRCSLDFQSVTAAAYSPPSSSGSLSPPPPMTSVEGIRERIFRMAAMQPVHIDPESVKPPKRRNVRISTDPQSVAARHRRERISERIRILQRMVPGGTKMDTASMLDEAIHYVKFLKTQVQSLERAAARSHGDVNQAYQYSQQQHLGFASMF